MWWYHTPFECVFVCVCLNAFFRPHTEKTPFILVPWIDRFFFHFGSSPFSADRDPLKWLPANLFRWNMKYLAVSLERIHNIRAKFFFNRARVASSCYTKHTHTALIVLRVLAVRSGLGDSVHSHWRAYYNFSFMQMLLLLLWLLETEEIHSQKPFPRLNSRHISIWLVWSDFFLSQIFACFVFVFVCSFVSTTT